MCFKIPEVFVCLFYWHGFWSVHTPFVCMAYLQDLKNKFVDPGRDCLIISLSRNSMKIINYYSCKNFVKR